MKGVFIQILFVTTSVYLLLPHKALVKFILVYSPLSFLVYRTIVYTIKPHDLPALHTETLPKLSHMKAAQILANIHSP